MGTHVGQCLKGGPWGMLRQCLESCSLRQAHMGSVWERWHSMGGTMWMGWSCREGAAEMKRYRLTVIPTPCPRITELGWKIPSRSWSPTINLTCWVPSLNHVLECHIHTSLKYLQGFRFHCFPGQYIPMLDHPLWEEALPKTQFKPPLVQFETWSSHTCLSDFWKTHNRDCELINQKGCPLSHALRSSDTVAVAKAGLCFPSSSFWWLAWRMGYLVC